MKILLSSIIAILATLFFIWTLRPLARRLGFVDRPGGRKQHHHDVPLIGGIAIFCGFAAALWSLPFSLKPYYALFAGGGLLLVMGIIDDFRELNSKLRLVGQIIAVLLMIFWGHIQVESFGDLLFFGNINLGLWGIPVTIILVVGFLNAMNMLDGQDGLAGGIAFGQVLLLSYLCWHIHHRDFAVLALFGALLLVFLAFNMRTPWRRHAAIFLGDAGSTFIAFTVAWFAISTGESGDIVKPAIILWILGFPVFDLLQVCFARLQQKKPLLLPSRDHFHHLLQANGVDATTSTWAMIMVSFALGLTGILLNYFQVQEGWQLLAWLCIFISYLGIVKFMRKKAAYQYVTSP